MRRIGEMWLGLAAYLFSLPPISVDVDIESDWYVISTGENAI